LLLFRGQLKSDFHHGDPCLCQDLELGLAQSAGILDSSCTGGPLGMEHRSVCNGQGSDQTNRIFQHLGLPRERIALQIYELSEPVLDRLGRCFVISGQMPAVQPEFRRRDRGPCCRKAISPATAELFAHIGYWVKDDLDFVDARPILSRGAACVA
jgi:hypothetical protein